MSNFSWNDKGVPMSCIASGSTVSYPVSYPSGGMMSSATACGQQMTFPTCTLMSGCAWAATYCYSTSQAMAQTQPPTGSYPTTCPSDQYSCNNVCIPNASSCNTPTYTPPYTGISSTDSATAGGTYQACPSGQYRDNTNTCVNNPVPSTPTPTASVINTLRFWFSRP